MPAAALTTPGGAALQPTDVAMGLVVAAVVRRTVQRTAARVQTAVIDAAGGRVLGRVNISFEADVVVQAGPPKPSDSGVVPAEPFECALSSDSETRVASLTLHALPAVGVGVRVHAAAAAIRSSHALAELARGVLASAERIRGSLPYPASTIDGFHRLAAFHHHYDARTDSLCADAAITPAERTVSDYHLITT